MTKTNSITMTHDHEWKSLGGRHDWCWFCGCLSSYRYERNYIRKPFKAKCLKRHRWKGWYELPAEKDNYWDWDHEWCSDCGAMKHKGATYELMELGERIQKTQIIYVGNPTMRDRHHVFVSLGLMWRKVS